MRLRPQFKLNNFHFQQDHIVQIEQFSDFNSSLKFIDKHFSKSLVNLLNCESSLQRHLAHSNLGAEQLLYIYSKTKDLTMTIFSIDPGVKDSLRANRTE